MASLVAQTVKHLPAMWKTRVRSLGWEDPLEKETATHSSTLAWKIPWEEPGRLQSMGSQRVRHDWATSLHFTLTQLVAETEVHRVLLIQRETLFWIIQWHWSAYFTKRMESHNESSKLVKGRWLREFLLNNFSPTNNEQLSVSCNLLESNPLDPEFTVTSGHVFVSTIQRQNKLVVTSISTTGKDNYIQIHFIMNL